MSTPHEPNQTPLILVSGEPIHAYIQKEIASPGPCSLVTAFVAFPSLYRGVVK